MFDFKYFDEVTLTDLFDICNYTCNETKPHFLHCLKSAYLCKKYSLTAIESTFNETMPLHEKCSIITISIILKEKLKLMIDEMKLLFTLTGSMYHFKTRLNKMQIKLHITCSHSHLFVRYESVSSSSNDIISKSRNTYTEKGIHQL